MILNCLGVSLRPITALFPNILFFFGVFSEPKSQGPQRPHENKANFSNSDHYPKDTPQPRSAHGDHRQQRNDRPPRFYRDADFPKPGQEPLFNCTASAVSAQGQHGKGQERWSRGTSDRHQNDRREILDGQSFPSFATTFTRSKDLQQQTEFSGSHHQRPRNGDGVGTGTGTGPAHRRGVKDGAPASKLTNSTGTEPDGKGGNKRPDRTEERNSNRRKYDRQNSDNADRQRDGGAPNASHRGGGTFQEPGFSQDNQIPPAVHAHLQNGVIEHRRTGPIKPPYDPIREPPPRKNPSNNPGSKRRPGPGKGPRGPDRGHYAEHSWKPGDQCLALYWEDSKVCQCSALVIILLHRYDDQFFLVLLSINQVQLKVIFSSIAVPLMCL